MESLVEEYNSSSVNVKDYQELFKEILEIVETILSWNENESCRCSDIWLKDTLIALSNWWVWEEYRNMEKWDIAMIAWITMKILEWKL